MSLAVTAEDLQPPEDDEDFFEWWRLLGDVDRDELPAETFKSCARRFDGLKRRYRLQEFLPTVPLDRPQPADPLFASWRRSDTLLLASPSPREHLFVDPEGRGILPFGNTGMVVAAGGTGKGHLGTLLCLAAATGVPVLDHFHIGDVGPGSVVAIFGEDDDAELHRRFFYAGQALGLTDERMERAIERLNVVSVVSRDARFTAGGQFGGGVEPTRRVDEVIEFCAALRSDLRLIWIDPASRFRGGDENDNDAATVFVTQLERIAQAAGASVLVAHHVSRLAMRDTGDPTQAASRGASALVDGVRWVANLQAMTEGEAKALGVAVSERRRYVRFHVTKNNYAPPQEQDVWLARGEHGVLSRVDFSGAAERVMRQRVEEVVRLVDAEAREGRTYTETAFREQFGGAKADPLRLSDHQLRRVLEAAMDSGRLRVHRDPSANGRAKGVLVVSQPMLGGVG